MSYKNKRKNGGIEPNKMIVEILLIVISASYLFSYLLSKKTTLVFYLIFVFISLFEIFVKNIKKTFQYNKNKKIRVYSGIISFIDILLLFSFFMKYIIGNKILLFTYICKYGIILLFVYLLIIGINSLIKLKKTKQELIHNIVVPIFSLFSLVVMLLCYYNIHIK